MNEAYAETLETTWLSKFEPGFKQGCARTGQKVLAKIRDGQALYARMGDDEVFMKQYFIERMSQTRLHEVRARPRKPISYLYDMIL